MKKKNVLVLTVLLLVAVTVGMVSVTYSRYVSTFNTASGVTAAKWNIKVTDKGVTDKEEFSLNNFTWTHAGNVKDGVIAPGSEGVATIVIDTTETEVDTVYEVVVDDAALAGTNLTAVLSEAEGTITMGGKKEVTLTVRWVDKDTAVENEKDTGDAATTFNLPVTVTVTQKVAEQ